MQWNLILFCFILQDTYKVIMFFIQYIRVPMPTFSDPLGARQNINILIRLTLHSLNSPTMMLQTRTRVTIAIVMARRLLRIA